jgi:hypothetical protein
MKDDTHLLVTLGVIGLIIGAAKLMADDGVNLTRTITVKAEVRRLVDSVVVSTTSTNVLTLIAHSNVGAEP